MNSISKATLCARGLAALGIERGDRVALLVRPSQPLFVLTFGLLRRGAVPVLIDPGIGRVHLARCLAEAGPKRLHRRLRGARSARSAGLGERFRSHARDRGRPVVLGRRSLRGRDEGRRKSQSHGPFHRPVQTTSPPSHSPRGAPGRPRGRCTRHQNLAAQALLLRDHFGIRPGERDLATFPLFAFFDPVWQATGVIPRMDFTRPGSVDPRCIIGPMLEQGVTHAFGSPALLDRVGRWGVERGVKLPTLKRVLSAGAPVSGRVLERFARLLEPDAEIHTPYGATEALPICSISLRELRAETGDDTARGRGVCVGRPLPQVRLEVIRITDSPIEQLVRFPARATEMKWASWWSGVPNVSKEYWNRPEATQLAKILSAAGEVGHRTGDVGSIDAMGRVWFCGRKSHRVVTQSETLFSVACEGVFNQHPRVRRTALVGMGVAPNSDPRCVSRWRTMERSIDLRSSASCWPSAQHAPRRDNVETILFHHRFPVDIRHNAKIFRERLAAWASRQVS